MAVDLVDYNGFDEFAAVGELSRAKQEPTGPAWTGTASSLQVGWDGSGQCVRGPSNLKLTITSSSYTSLVVRGRIKVRSLGSLQTLVSIGIGVSQQGDLKLNASNQLILVNIRQTGGDVTSTTTVDNTTDWHEFEFAWYLHDTAGAWRVVWDNSEVTALTATNQDTIYSAASTLDYALFNNANIDVDDVVVWASTIKYVDSDFYSTPGRTVSIASLRPDGAGQYSGWDNITNTTGNDYGEVDEVLHDGATSYLRAASTPQKELFAIAAFPPAIAAYKVHAFRVMVSNETETGTAQGNNLIRYGGVDYDGATGGDAGTASGSDTWVNGQEKFRVSLWTVVPGTSTKLKDMAVEDAIAVVNSIEAGFNNTGSSFFPCLISQVSVQVLYITGPTPAPASSTANVVAFKNSHRLVKTMLVERTDGITLAFTDHDHELILDGVTFQPVHSMSGSAIRRELMLKDQSTEFYGAISSAAITDRDLLAGRYRDARITERVVDWKYPWAGDAVRNIYKILETKQDGRVWRASTGGLTRLLQRRIGLIIGRVCRWKLGGPGCLVNMTPFTYTGVDVTAVTSRREFEGSSADIPLLADDYFNLGEVLWITGDNAGIVSEVMDYNGSTRSITLFLPTPFDIQVADTFTIKTGCDGLPSTCKATYSNFPNFGGEPFIPGRNRTFPQV